MILTLFFVAIVVVVVDTAAVLYIIYIYIYIYLNIYMRNRNNKEFRATNLKLENSKICLCKVRTKVVGWIFRL